MYARIKVSDLKPGMFVHLTGNWLSHSFITNRFLIKNDKQIAKILDAGFEEVDVDLSRTTCECSNGIDAIYPQDPMSVARIERCANNIAETAESVLPPYQKAQAIYHESTRVIKSLLESPTAETIAASRNAIQHVASVVLADPETVQCLFMVSAHDFYTYTHSVSVGVYATALAHQIYGDGSSHDMEELAIGFFLHDLGKVHIDPAIITKPAKLTDQEYNAMKQHPIESYEIIKACEHMTPECSLITLQHHERINGEGYPNRLTGSEIHEYAKICAIADVFDALTSNRSYRKPLSPFEALDLMINKMPGHFDPAMLSTFIRLFHSNASKAQAA